jgi:integrase
MMAILPEPAKTVVGVAAFTGLRKSELRGLKWQDWVETPGPDRDTATSLFIQRTVWNTTTEKTKTKASKDLVPVIKGTVECPLVHELLEAHWNGHPADGFVFVGEKLSKSLNLSNLARRVIVPALDEARAAKKSDVEWHGWHAFRRGLATNLDELGVDHKVIAAIPRHANEKVTEDFYIKTRRPKLSSQKAMKQIGEAFAVAVRNARTEARSHSSEK